MSKSTVNTILWFLFLTFVGFFSYSMTRVPRLESISVGPHDTYTWYNDSKSVLQSDGTTHVYLKSTSGNFSVFDTDDLYVASGLPDEMLPGETEQAFVADFQLTEGKAFNLSDSPVEIYTLEPATLTFESFRYGYAWIAVICLLLLFFTLALL
ncbi:hypothetical protein A3K29_06030 [Candidatus Collierbacteria bacterium RIFOXYB2_FULL_46_14]|uniref:Uncharacterized protein n=1 Tax=Candidatus Collierbacteria bacterium GW2011_GWA2_46_26 TaxID=1618381 RepID=A0A0G1PI47_9BACT|nr:MAG: hypothetical protein UX47_C0013G0026 [Candidatus Collierbacteria bacterium GW2011_GWA2_46_26]OGD73648.1 MAG: hypothetical protein A3K29_06030 [Candidatus Collierbacteria bacterium RIFOXYB2_FULL_46_14]OGD76690.1 MAG: hypothetical protein A3K43_06030 [Candidatus Collierbacteria bacterium RIFOXYA2_FULL_46_20]OGD78026.1 MAG: hypothetical protein A3K39_06030 [Candidatus Collierbacteria bacterium RIFOXYC2_FULL_43_15]OGD80050.1 MAG: hypothetical protein A2320_00460 [Pseudomonadales bacterium G